MTFVLHPSYRISAVARRRAKQAQDRYTKQAQDRYAKQAQDRYAEQDQPPYDRRWLNRPGDVLYALFQLWIWCPVIVYFFWQWLEEMQPGCVAKGYKVWFPIVGLMVPEIILGPCNPIATISRGWILGDVYPNSLDKCLPFSGDKLAPFMNYSLFLEGKQGYIEHDGCPHGKKERIVCTDPWRVARFFGFPTQCPTEFFPRSTAWQNTTSPDDPNGPKIMTPFVLGHGGPPWSPWDRGDMWVGIYFIFNLWIVVCLPSYPVSGHTLSILPFTFLLWICYCLLACYRAAYCGISTCYSKAVEFRNKYRTTENFSNRGRSQQPALTYPGCE